MPRADTFLVTGGAGYIGAHVVRALCPFGRVVVLDDLSTGTADTIPEDVAFVEGSILDESLVRTALREHEVTCCVHLAAKKAPGESVLEPELYFDNNVLGTQVLLRAMLAEGVRQMVFSSSCSVYGSKGAEVIDESTPVHPESPYGQTKLFGEWMIEAIAKAAAIRDGASFRWIALRYFNVIGAAGPGLGDRGSQNLVPLALKALRSGSPFTVHGDDWPTRDGTCIRDYVDVEDLAEAHRLAVELLQSGEWAGGAVNVSTGTGSSVLDVVHAIETAASHSLPCVFGPRRPGDPAAIVGSADSARDLLGWFPRVSLGESVRRAIVAAVDSR